MTGLQQILKISNKCVLHEFRRNYASPCKKILKKLKDYENKSRRIESVGTSLASRGFLRATKSYSPSRNVAQEVTSICEELKIPTQSHYEFSSLDEKFKILAACFTNFKHAVPNSQIYELKTIDNLIAFYETSVDTTTPYDAFRNAELPENLHITYEYTRFNSQTDTKFGGQTAFPKSSTLVTGLKYRDKYSGNIAKRSWP